MPITAAVIGDLRVQAVLAAHDMAAESRRAAALDRRHHLQLAENRAISSRLKTTGILRGSRTNVRCLVISGRSSVTVKKKRSAATEPLMLGARTPACV